MPRTKRRPERKVPSLGGGQPPNIQASVAYGHTFRFTSSGNTARNVNVGTLIGACGNTCVIANTSMNSWASSVKIKSIRIWSPAAAAADVSASVAWAATLNNVPDDEKLASTVGSAFTGYFRSVPPRKSLASDWWSTTAGAQILFSITAPTNSIVDVTVAVRLCNVLPLQNLGIATGVLGNVYYGYLDGAATHSFVPVGLPSTF